MDSATDRSARRWLSRMSEELASGWPALGRPALRQQFTQHLHGVDDAIRTDEELTGRAVPASRLVLIAGHAYDLRQEALRSGWRPPADESAWTADEWYGLRLLACHELASRERRGPKPALLHAERSSIVGLIRGSRPG
ncbi:DUF6401 family natural product biosynthesis protein [Saccharomonospora sp. NPDC006951]